MTSLIPHPDLATTPEGFGRTDAFGRISNNVARFDYQLPLVAPVSFPPMWGMKYSNLFHFNGNTNSVIMRNIGQAFGLGALLLDDNYLATVNIHNLNKLEKHLYNIKYPQWNALAPDDLHVTEADIPEVVKGCKIYANQCMSCHHTDQRVGPAHKLINYTVQTFGSHDTDSNHTKIQHTPVKLADGTKVPFRRALFELTKNIKERYIETLSVNNASLRAGNRAETLKDWGNFGVRGKEHFRDTYLGEDFSDSWLDSVFDITSSDIRELKYMTAAPKKLGYIAKDLAGVLGHGSLFAQWISAQYGRLVAKGRPASQNILCGLSKLRS